MKTMHSLTWFALVAGFTFSAFADGKPPLPKQYAEAVFQVEGMI